MSSEDDRYLSRCLSGLSGFLLGVCLGLMIFGIPAMFETMSTAYDPVHGVAHSAVFLF
jgi:hypothetical protein